MNFAYVRADFWQANFQSSPKNYYTLGFLKSLTMEWRSLAHLFLKKSIKAQR